MTQPLVMRIFSRRPLTVESAEVQINALSSFEDGCLRPEKWAPYEPIRRIFDSADLREPVEALSSPAGKFMYRHNLPTRFSGEIWNRSRPKLLDNAPPRFPAPLFLNYWTAGFDPSTVKRLGVTTLQSFAISMFEAAAADFGLLTSSHDLEAKNYQIIELPTGARSMGYVGLDPAKGMPGLYWMTFFSSALAKWLRIDESLAEGPYLQALNHGGRMLQFGEDPSRCDSPDMLDQQRRVIEQLNSSRFFDIRHPDRLLEAPVWE